MAHDVIFAKDIVDSDRPEFAMTQNARKRCCCTTFDLIGLLPTNHIIAYSIIAYRKLQETLDVNSIKITQTTQNIWNFILGKSTPQEVAKFGNYRGGFHTLTWRLGDTVQNLVSPGLSGRVDSTASEGGFPHVWAVQWFLAQATTCFVLRAWVL